MDGAWKNQMMYQNFETIPMPELFNKCIFNSTEEFLK